MSATDARPSLFEYAGGSEAFQRLAAAHHARCLADEELNHPFTGADVNPRHVERLGAYWAEVMGGPSTFSADYSNQSAMLERHVCHEDLPGWGQRFLGCFLAAMDDAALPADPDFRTAMRAYMEWAVGDVLQYFPGLLPVPDDPRLPHWTWTGLEVH
jgi:hemoglobin